MYDQQEGIGRISKLVVLNPPLWLLRYRFGEEEQQIKLFEAPEKNKKINKYRSKLINNRSDRLRDSNRYLDGSFTPKQVIIW